MVYKEVLGLTATIVAFASYVPYFRDIFSGKTKPHAFSWLVFGIITLIGFIGQLYGNAGPGAWVTGFSGLICFIIFYFALKKGEKNIVLLDWVSLVGAFIAILFWVFTKDPLLSVVLITLISILGFFPTIRKSYMKPNQETLVSYTLSGLKFVLSLFALNSFSIITALYPISIIILNWSFVVMLTLRRNQLGR